MKFRFNDAKTNLIIEIDEDEQNELKEMSVEEDFSSDDKMHDFLEPLIANSELQWIDPAVTGDLTDAPMIGILGEDEFSKEENKPGSGYVSTGATSEEFAKAPVLYRWAYMDYQLRSPLQDLLESRKVVFIGGELVSQ